MYIIQVQNIEGTKTEYFRAKTRNDAILFQMSSTNFVNIYTAHDFLSKLPLINLSKKLKNDFDVIL